MPATLIYDSSNEAATEALGSALAEVLPRGIVVALCGSLGAGKTRLVQAIAAAVGVDRRMVLSPTFVLIHEYPGRVPIYHFDAYRLESDDEFERIGPEDYFSGNGWSLVEWADKVWSVLPAERLEIRIQTTGETARRFEISAVGPRYAGVLDALAARLAPQKIK